MESGMISVDKWSSGSQAYFLTHLHADHTVGLSSTWNHGPLFCSRLTAKLFPCIFPDFRLSLIRVLDIGSWNSIPLVTPSSGAPTKVYVKAIDALHCPGSVMYLFSGEFGCMLFTGDFRWEASGNGVETGRAMLLDSLKNQTLNKLYLDNTYCNPTYSFPSREVASQKVVDIIASHPNHDIIIAIDSLGKEDLLLYIAHSLNIKIWVWPERLRIMHLLGFHENFTTRTSLTRVRAVPRYSFSIETLEGLNKFRPTVGVMPSGLPWATKFTKQNLFNSSHDLSADLGSGNIRYHKYMYVVPYSAHSCFSEIQEFVELIRPVNIKGIVSSTSCHIDPCYYFDHLCGTQQAFWRMQQRVDGDETREEVEGAKMEPTTDHVVRRKRRMSQVEFCGIRVSRVKLMRKSGHGGKLSDSQCFST